MSRKSGKQGKFQTQIKICILQIKVGEASLCWHKVNLSIEFHVLLHEEPRTDACASLFEGPPNGHLDRVALPPPANFSGTFSYNPSLFSFKIFPLSWKVKNTYEKLLRLIYHETQGKMTICGWKSRILATFWYYPLGAYRRYLQVPIARLLEQQFVIVQ